MTGWKSWTNTESTGTSTPSNLIGVVQYTVAPNATSTSFGVTTTAGNTLVVAICGLAGAGTPSVSAVTLGGSAGNFAQATSAYDNISQGTFTSIWCDPDCAAGTAIAVTATNLTLTADYGIIIMEVQGLTASAAVDQTSSASNTTSSTWSSGNTPTTTSPSEFWVGSVSLAAAGTFPSSFTNLMISSNSLAGVGYLIASTEGVAVYTGTQV